MRKKNNIFFNKTEIRMLHWVQGVVYLKDGDSKESESKANHIICSSRYQTTIQLVHGHIKLRNLEDITITMLEMDLHGKRTRSGVLCIDADNQSPRQRRSQRQQTSRLSPPQICHA